MEAFSKMVSSVTNTVASATGATGATAANTSKPKNLSKWNTATGNKSPHVNFSAASGGMGAPSQKGGRCWNKKNKNKSKKNRNRKNKTRKNRK